MNGPSFQSSVIASTREEEVAGVREGGRQTIREPLFRLLDEARAGAALARPADADPAQLRAEARRLPVARVEARHRFHHPPRVLRDVGVARTRERAPRRAEVLEDHDVAALGVEVRVPRARHAHRHVGRELAVEARLRESEASLVDETALACVERCELDEDGCGQIAPRACGVGEAEPGAARRAGVALEQLDRFDRCVEDAPDPRGRQLFDLDRNAESVRAHSVRVNATRSRCRPPPDRASPSLHRRTRRAPRPR